MTRAIVLAAISALALAFAGQPTAAIAESGSTGLKVVDRIAGPDGGWDYASFDAAHRRVYIAHGAQVTAIDADTGVVTPLFAAGDRLHAVVPVPNSNLIVTTNSGDSSARVIDATSGKLIASIHTPDDPDSAIYDPHTGTVVVIGGDSGAITLIDAKAGKIKGQFTPGGKLEFAVPDGFGRLYVNDEEKAEIVVVDLDALKVVAHYPMAGCMRPTGLAYVEGHRLVSACQSVATILDANDGRVIASLPIGVGPDAVIYDAARSMSYIPSGRAGTLSVIALSGPANNTVIDTIPTAVGARTGTVDPKTGRVYLPSAEYGPVVTGQRPAMKPGTFRVLVVGK